MLLHGEQCWKFIFMENKQEIWKDSWAPGEFSLFSLYQRRHNEEIQYSNTIENNKVS